MLLKVLGGNVSPGPDYYFVDVPVFLERVMGWPNVFPNFISPQLHTTSTLGRGIIPEKERDCLDMEIQK